MGITKRNRGSSEAVLYVQSLAFRNEIGTSQTEIIFTVAINRTWSEGPEATSAPGYVELKLLLMRIKCIWVDTIFCVVSAENFQVYKRRRWNWNHIFVIFISFSWQNFKSRLIPYTMWSNYSLKAAVFNLYIKIEM